MRGSSRKAGWIKGTPPKRDGRRASGKDVDHVFKQMGWWKKDTAAFEKRQTSFKDMVTGYDQNSTAGDQALIITYLKVLDPISVVREGEFIETAEDGWRGVEKMNAVVGSRRRVRGGSRRHSAMSCFRRAPGLYFNMMDKHMENRRHTEERVQTASASTRRNLKSVVDQKTAWSGFTPFRNVPTTRDMRAPTQQAGRNLQPRPNPNAMSGTDAPGAGMMQPRSGASGAVGGGEPLGGAPGPMEYQYGQPGPGQPRGEFDMLAAGGLTTPGYGGPRLAGAAGEGTTWHRSRRSPQGLAQLQDGHLGRDLMQLRIALRDITKLAPITEMGATEASMPERSAYGRWGK